MSGWRGEWGLDFCPHLSPQLGFVSKVNKLSGATLTTRQDSKGWGNYPAPSRLMVISAFAAP